MVSGQPLVLSGHGDRVHGVAFSHDGERLASASYDHMVRIWNSDGSGEPALLHIPEIDAHSAAFSPDGTRIVTTCHNERDPVTNKTHSWATVWPTFERFSGLNDPALWTATRYCPSPALREQLLGKMAKGVAEARFRRCQERVGTAFATRQTARP